MFYYLYIIENKINGKRYVGRRKTKLDPLTDGYYGSGRKITEAINIEGVQNFSKIIHSMYDNLPDLIEAEDNFIKENNVANDPLWL